MKFSEYLDSHYSFYRTIILQLGLHCPLQCRHCSVFAGPHRRQRMPVDLVQKALRDFAQVPGAGLVVLTGGEPFAMREQLAAALGMAEQHGLRSHVITAASWAASVEEATRVLQELPAISLMTVSADIYHEEFVPLEYVRNAIHAAHALGRDVLLSIATEGHDETYPQRVRACVRAQIMGEIEQEVLPVMPTGRAKVHKLGSFDKTRAPLPEGACDMLGTPVVMYNGSVSACCQIDACNEAPTKAPSLYRIGNAYSDTYDDLRLRVENDELFQAIRVWGPKYLVGLLDEANHSFARKESYDGVCFLCRDLLRNDGAVKKLREILKPYAIRNEVRLSRMLLYGEIRPCPDGVIYHD